MKRLNTQIKSSKPTRASRIVKPEILVKRPKASRKVIIKFSIILFLVLIVIIMLIIAFVVEAYTHDSIPNFYANLFIFTWISILLFCMLAMNARKAFIDKSFKATTIKHAFAFFFMVAF